MDAKVGFSLVIMKRIQQYNRIGPKKVASADSVLFCTYLSLPSLTIKIT